MSDPLSSTRSPEPRFALPPPSTGASSDSFGASSSQPDGRNHAYSRKAAQSPTPRVFATSDSTVSCSDILYITTQVNVSLRLKYFLLKYRVFYLILLAP